MIKLHMLGEQGNNIFQYAFARLLAGELGYAVEVSFTHRGGPKDVDGFVTLMSGNRLIEPSGGTGTEPGPIECRERLGGMLRYYYREAA